MTINIVCTSKPCDGLFYYSYEYCAYLNSVGCKSKLIIITHRKFSKIDYITSLANKYVSCENIVFDEYSPSKQDVSLILGRSMLSLAYIDFDSYSLSQQQTLKALYSEHLISVYSENHPEIYPKALDFFAPKHIIDLCDKEVYPNGVGLHFEKTINFDIYKPYAEEIQFQYLFLGTNDKYYSTVKNIIDQYSNHGIITYNEKYIDTRYNNVFVPIVNLLGIFETYVYTKETFDPAPRLLQECKYFGKELIYERDKNIKDGGAVYLERELKTPDIASILEAAEEKTQ